MLVKEYRICLPMTVEEYRIAQLYMIQKKSREESSGAGSGVEILVNDPYQDGPGGNGQYTHKIYHIGSHLPGWFRAILPKSALMVEEEAWNAYPYTKTIYRCPFIEKFSLEIETRYLNDGGECDNVFSLSQTELRSRTIDFLDIVRDPISSGDYKKEEDPKIFRSEKTGRGPLPDNWREVYTAANKEPETSSKRIMCAYKLCKVEFKYWGMQSKIERFIHDVGLRKTMLRAHRQAWAWQDEYHGLTIEDIRALERETQRALQEKMAKALAAEDGGEQSSNSTKAITSNTTHVNSTAGGTQNDTSDTSHKANQYQTANGTTVQLTSGQQMSPVNSITGGGSSGGGGIVSGGTTDLSPSHDHMKLKKTSARGSISSVGASRKQSWSSTRSHLSTYSGSKRNLGEWMFGSLEKLKTSSSDEDEFFDAHDSVEELDTADQVGEAGHSHDHKLLKSSSMEMLTSAGNMAAPHLTQPSFDEGMSPLDRRMEAYQRLQSGGSGVMPIVGDTPQSSVNTACKTTILFIVLHGGSVMDTGQEQNISKHGDVSTLETTVNTVINAHYPSLHGHVAFRLVACGNVCAESLHLLASLNPLTIDNSTPTLDKAVVTNNNFPLSAIPLFASGSPEYCDMVMTTVTKVNSVYHDFLKSEKGQGFNGQVCLIADSIGSILAYDALCKNNPYLTTPYSTVNSVLGSNDALNETNDQLDNEFTVKPQTSLEPIKQVSLSNPDLTVTDATPSDETLQDTPENISNADAPLSKPERQQVPIHKQLSAPTTKPHYRQAISCPSSRRTSSGSQGGENIKFEFEVSDLFLLGSPIAMVLAYRKLCMSGDARRSNILPRPACSQIYNLYYPTDPSALRLEPLIMDKFKHVMPVKVPRYQKFPLGDGNPLHILEAVQSQMHLFTDVPPSTPHSAARSDSSQAKEYERRLSNMSISSQVSGHWDYTLASVSAVTSRWWGQKRLDYALYSPDALQVFPNTALPYLLHASFWESLDVAAFMIRQVVRQDLMLNTAELGGSVPSSFIPSNPREKWLKRRTTIKLRNVAPNHRANDTVVLEDKPQNLSARFMYGPLDMVSLTGEKVDIHVMKSQPNGEWTYLETVVTDGNGRASYKVPEDKRLPQGIYPVKMVVRGDHTSVDFSLTVLPPKTYTVLFSIDGSFTASMSIMGKDPKVRPGAVDVVRHWQDLGYLIMYITARPDMQKKKVVAWLAQHNFPHGMVVFMDGLSADPLKQKTNYIKHLTQEADIVIRGAYGSSKDIYVYQSVGVTAENIFIVGKVSKKQYKEAVVLSDGYAAHLQDLASPAGPRPATGNARLFLRKSCFSLPGQHARTSSKKSVRKTLSMPMKGSYKEVPPPTQRNRAMDVTIGVGECGNTVLDPVMSSVASATNSRGKSPKGRWANTPRHDSSHV